MTQQTRKTASRNLAMFEVIAKAHGDTGLVRLFQREGFLIGPVPWGLR